MSISNYQHGFKNGVTIRGVPVEISHPGRVFWVGNNVTRLDNEKTASDGNDGTFLAPYSTLEGALNASAVVASRGDILFVRPGHTLTIGTATALNFDKAGVAVIGLGMGTSRPTITFDTATTVTIPVTVANMAIRNFILRANLDNIVSVFTLTAATNFSVEDCLIDDTSAALHFQALIDTNTTDGAADGLYFANNVRLGLAVASFSLFLADGAMDRWTILNNYIRVAHVPTTGLVATAAAKNMLNLRIEGNTYINRATDGSTGILLSATDASTTTGIVLNNTAATADASDNVLLIVSNYPLLALGENKIWASTTLKQFPLISTAN